MVRRSDGGASLVLEDATHGQALELRLAASGRFTGGAWRASGEPCELVAFRVTARGTNLALIAGRWAALLACPAVQGEIDCAGCYWRFASV